MPEEEDLLAVKRGVPNYCPCHRCIVQKEDMPKYVCGEPRSYKDTENLFQSSSKSGEAFIEILKVRSMLEIPPILTEFPMMGINTIIDI